MKERNEKGKTKERQRNKITSFGSNLRYAQKINAQRKILRVRLNCASRNNESYAAIQKRAPSRRLVGNLTRLLLGSHFASLALVARQLARSDCTVKCVVVIVRRTFGAVRVVDTDLLFLLFALLVSPFARFARAGYICFTRTVAIAALISALVVALVVARSAIVEASVVVNRVVLNAEHFAPFGVLYRRRAARGASTPPRARLRRCSASVHAAAAREPHPTLWLLSNSCAAACARRLRVCAHIQATKQAYQPAHKSRFGADVRGEHAQALLAAA